MRKFYKTGIVTSSELGMTVKKPKVGAVKAKAIFNSAQTIALAKVNVTAAQHASIIADGGVEVTLANVNTEAKALQAGLTDKIIDIWKLN